MLSGNGRDPDIDELFRLAANRDEVATIHAHVPDRTITVAWIEAMLDIADAGGLWFVTYVEMQPGLRRAAVALASGASRFVKST
jgi:hypothetical protein